MDIGMWSGGTIANGTVNPFQWDYSSGKTWGYMAGGAIIGGVAGYAGASLYASGMAAATAAGYGGFSAGFNAGMISGMAAGAINGGGMAALSGNNILGAATMGAWMGGVMGGVFGGLSEGIKTQFDSQYRRNFWTGRPTGFKTTQNLSLSSPVFSTPEINTSGMRTKLTIGSDNTLIELGELRAHAIVVRNELLMPVDASFRITSPYMESNRVIPELGINKPHLAIDLGTPIGTPIQSPFDGVVTMASDTQYGPSVIIRHNYQYNGQMISTGYAHLSRLSVSVNQAVRRGYIIGYTGTWGTGPHLHFTLRMGTTRINPTILFPYR